MRMRHGVQGPEPVMKSGLRGKGWKRRPTVSSARPRPLRPQPSSAGGAGKSDSRLACLRGQGDRELGPRPPLRHTHPAWPAAPM